MLGKIEAGGEGDDRRWRWLDAITDSMDMRFSKAPGTGEGQGSLACCSLWGHKESRLND